MSAHRLSCALARLGLPFCLALLGALLAVLTGCEREAPLSLVTVTEVAPRDVERGERIEVTGAGFPRGRRARLLLQGTLHRAGAEPRRGFEAQAEGIVVSERSLEVVYDDRLQALLCGPEGQAAHTTFRGEVTVAFAAAIPGAPPASASLPGVVLDLRPPPPAPALSKRLREGGERFIEASGITIDEAAEVRGGLLIA